MQHDEANNLVARLKSLIPTMNADQGASLVAALERYEVGPASAAVESHFLTHVFVNGRDLLAEVDRLSKTNVSARQYSEASALESRMAKRKVESETVEASHARAIAAIARLPESERQRLKVKALAANPFLASRLADADPLKSPTLVGLIAVQLQPLEAK